MTSSGRGERVDCSKKRSQTPRQKLERLYELAKFDSVKVKWRTFYLSGMIGTGISIAILQTLKHNKLEPRLPLQLLIMFVPTFLASMLIMNFRSFHGADYKHPLYAYRFRVALERQLLNSEAKSDVD